MKHRTAAIVPAYFATYVGCYAAAYLLRFDFHLPADFSDLFWGTLPVLLLVKAITCLSTGAWQRSFRYASLSDIPYIVSGATIATALFFVLNATVFTAIDLAVPRGVIVIDWLLAIPAIGLLHSHHRLFLEIVRPLFGRQDNHRALIYGAGPDGIGLLRTMQSSNTEYEAVGLIADVPKKSRVLVGGVTVHSKWIDWSTIVSRSRASHLLIPSAVPGPEVRELVALCSESGLKAHVIPAVNEIVDGRYKLAIRDVAISDLLRREPTELDNVEISKCIRDQRVLVTGAAGSIGAEICRQLLRYEPASLVLVDHSELGMFTISQEFEARTDCKTPLRFVVANVTDQKRMDNLFSDFDPELVFHAAAYKHVPLMEENPQSAIRNNIVGTKTVVDLCDQHGVDRFVLISTDKAVCPSSIMGATKLVAEKYVQAVSAESKTQFVTVRFGNVLNSAGSVVPTFRRQIAEGGPITVTHADMERFFMTIPEAVQLVLQAGAIGGSGDVLILEMGEPVKIVNLARDMISLSGLKYPDDINIVFSGMRPGEKLREELFYSSEERSQRVHDKIFCGRRTDVQIADIDRDIALLETASRRLGADAATVLRDVVAAYVQRDEAPPTSLRPAA